MVIIYLENSSKFDLPKYAHPGDSGMDIRANIDSPVKLGPLERYIFPTGIKALIPRGFEIQVRSRSGLAAKRGLAVLNSPGTVDAKKKNK